MPCILLVLYTVHIGEAAMLTRVVQSMTKLLAVHAVSRVPASGADDTLTLHRQV